MAGNYAFKRDFHKRSGNVRVSGSVYRDPAVEVTIGKTGEDVLESALKWQLVLPQISPPKSMVLEDIHC